MSRCAGRVSSIALLVASALLSSCGSDLVRLPDCIDCRPVEMTVDQELEIELGSDRSVTNDPDAFEWIVVDAGTMTLVSEDRGTRPEDENEFVGGYSRYVIYTFAPAAVGTASMQFDFVPLDDPGGQPVNTLSIIAVVSE
jgi:hypothetical protein